MEKIFLSCDWGTTSFRLRVVEVGSAKVLATVSSDNGVAKVYAQWQQQQGDRLSFYQSILQESIMELEKQLQVSLQQVGIVISGMASSSIGMMELPYKQLPFAIAAENFRVEKIAASEAFEHELLLVSGCKTEADVMRGEETQLLGCNTETSENPQLFIFPGTHSKHVVVTSGLVVSLQTFMTGEFFHLLATQSILAQSIVNDGTIDAEDNKQAFVQGVHDSIGQNLLHTSFMVRTNQLFGRFSKVQNYWYLSGLLIGSELGGLARRQYGTIHLVGETKFAHPYQLAIRVLDSDNQLKIIDVIAALVNAHLLFYPLLNV